MLHSNSNFTLYVPCIILLYIYIQLVQNAPDDVQMRSETCRANISAEKTANTGCTKALLMMDR